MEEPFVKAVVLVVIGVSFRFALGRIASRLGARKGNTEIGFWLGFLLGLLGVLITIFLPQNQDLDNGTSTTGKVSRLNKADLEQESVRIECPKCESSINAKVELIGSNMTCTHCGETVRVPFLSACPACHRQISIRAKCCTHCGVTVAQS